MVLSICMIVKNEEKNLERCLDSLRPLLEEIDSELIITDTGSTDRTVEIAKRYTDQVLHFDWCDDFAKARNYGIEHAKGEWLMTLDADEQFVDDLSEMIHFFQSDLKNQYVRASGVMKNVLDPTDRDKMTNEHNVIHFYRMDTNPRYEGRIHETVPMALPCYQFPFMGYHYGYAFANEEEILAKKKRNMPLLRKELEENPDDVRTLVLAIESSYDSEEKIELLHQLIEATKKTDIDILKLSGYKHIVEQYLDLNKWEKVVEMVEEFEKTTVANQQEYDVIKIDIWYAMTVALYRLEQYEQARKYADYYLNLYHQYEKGNVDRMILVYVTVNSLYDTRYNEMQLIKVETLVKGNRKKEAIQALSQIREQKMEEEHLTVSMNYGVELAEQPKIEPIIKRLYQAIQKQEKANELYGTLVRKIASLHEKGQKLKVANTFLKALETESSDLKEILSLIATQNQSSWRTQFDVYLRQITNWNIVFPEVYYMALKAEIDMPKEAYQLKIARIQGISNYLLTTHKEEVLFLLKSVLSMTGTGQAEFYKLTLFGDLLEKAIRYLEQGKIGEEWTKEERKEVQKRLLRGYAKVVRQLLDCIYRPEILTAENMELLPTFHQLGYWLDGAYVALDSGDYKKSEWYIKKFVETDKTMKNVANWFIEEYEEIRAMNESKPKTEFEQLAENVKKSIRQFMAQGQLVEAKQLLLQIKALCPDDREIDEMLELLRKQGI